MELFPGTHGAALEKFLFGVFLATCLVVLSWLATRKISNADGLKNEIIPEFQGKFLCKAIKQAKRATQNTLRDWWCLGRRQ